MIIINMIIINSLNLIDYFSQKDNKTLNSQMNSTKNPI